MNCDNCSTKMLGPYQIGQCLDLYRCPDCKAEKKSFRRNSHRANDEKTDCRRSEQPALMGPEHSHYGSDDDGGQQAHSAKENAK